MIGFQIGAKIILWGVLVNASFCQVLLGPSIGAGTNYLRKLVMRVVFVLLPLFLFVRLVLLDNDFLRYIF